MPHSAALGFGTKWTFMNSLQKIQNIFSQQPAHLEVSTSFLELFISWRIAEIHVVLPYKVTGLNTIQAKN